MNNAVQYVNILLVAALTCGAQETSSRDWASLVGQRFKAERDVVYRTVDGIPLKLDLYIPYDAKPGPTLLYIHGGGWQSGSKEQYVLWYLPYLQLGMRVVAVQYRLSGLAPAPAAVEDCKAAFEWVVANGAKYGLDPKRMVVTGGSAGGHLALMTALAAGEGRVKAVVNYYGATDMVDLLKQGKDYHQKWFRGARPGLAKEISPLTWVKPGGPPVLTIHGDGDAQIPYSHALRLHQALDAAKVPNQLVTIPGGAHGRHTWSDADTIRVQREIEAFLNKHVLR